MWWGTGKVFLLRVTVSATELVCAAVISYLLYYYKCQVTVIVRQIRSWWLNQAWWLQTCAWFKFQLGWSNRGGEGWVSRGEAECRDVLRKLFPHHTFVKVRPDWQQNPHTGQNLELDLFCGELALAVEFNGIQHYRKTPKFHLKPNERALPKNEQDEIMRRRLYGQQCRDRTKMQNCNRNFIDLVVVRYDDPRSIYEILSSDPCIISRLQPSITAARST